MPHIKTLISDADGTLVDTLYLIRHGLYETSKTYLIGHGVPSKDIPPYEVYEPIVARAIGGSARITIESAMRLLYERQPHHLEGMDFEELHAMLNPIQDALAAEYVHAYPGLDALLHVLSTREISLAVFTSGTPHHIVRNFGAALPQIGLVDLWKETTLSDHDKLQQFEEVMQTHYKLVGFTVVTCEDTPAHKPDPAGLNLAMKRLGANPNHSAMLGDHTVDIQAAVNAGIEARIGVTHGFDDEQTLKEAGASHIVHTLEELPHIIT